MCNNNCQLCPRFIISDSVTVATVNGVDTLVIDIPSGTYFNCSNWCIVVAQAIPATATINMPVAISIGGVTTTVYPLVRCDCAQVTACAIRTRTKYPVRVVTTATGGSFRVLRGLCCSPNNALTSLPVTTTTTPAAATVNTEAVATASSPVAVNVRTTKTATKKTTDKEEQV